MKILFRAVRVQFQSISHSKHQSSITIIAGESRGAFCWQVRQQAACYRQGLLTDSRPITFNLESVMLSLSVFCRYRNSGRNCTQTLRYEHTLRTLRSTRPVIIDWTSCGQWRFYRGGMVVAEATPKKARATPQATPNENMNFGRYMYLVYTLYIWKLLVPPLSHPTPPLEPPQIEPPLPVAALGENEIDLTWPAAYLDFILIYY